MVAGSEACPLGMQADPILIRHVLSWRLAHEKISAAILLLPLIQEEQLSVTGERMCIKVNCLGGLPRSSMIWVTDHA